MDSDTTAAQLSKSTDTRQDISDHESSIPPDDQSADVASIDFVTLGMFIIGEAFPPKPRGRIADPAWHIIDDIDFMPPTPSVRNVIGGAGSYSALGGRLFSPPPLSGSIGWIIDQGSDFPSSISATIGSWKTTAVLRHDPQRLTTRGWNGYEGSAEKRAFRYMTPKKRLVAEDLTANLLQSRSFHLICSPTRCQQLVREITSQRKEAVPPEVYTRPIFIWEPVPDLCTPDELLNCTNTLPLIDICSPNHTELAGFMGDDGLDPETGRISKSAVERSCEQLLASMPLQSYTLVVRAGDQGCYIAKNAGTRRSTGPSRKRRNKHHGGFGLQPDTDMEALFAGLLRDDDGSVAREETETDPGLDRWLPAFHQDPANVVDPTGGGNTFLGGLAAGLARGETIEDAAAWGSVAASFAIEQVGMPTLTTDDDGHEFWNGCSVEERLRDFRNRISNSQR